MPHTDTHTLPPQSVLSLCIPGAGQGPPSAPLRWAPPACLPPSGLLAMPLPLFCITTRPCWLSHTPLHCLRPSPFNSCPLAAFPALQFIPHPSVSPPPHRPSSPQRACVFCHPMRGQGGSYLIVPVRCIRAMRRRAPTTRACLHDFSHTTHFIVSLQRIKDAALMMGAVRIK